MSQKALRCYWSAGKQNWAATQSCGTPKLSSPEASSAVCHEIGDSQGRWLRMPLAGPEQHVITGLSGQGSAQPHPTYFLAGGLILAVGF